MSIIPEGYEDLLQRPLYGHLATTRPDNSPQVNPMWFAWDGELIRFTNTSKRQKCKNIQAEPKFAMSVTDPDNPYRYLEVRGELVEILPDPGAKFFLELCARYSAPYTEPPADAADRVIIVVRPTKTSKQ
jgi:PPOX class probable F420-dependent enzyme